MREVGRRGNKEPGLTARPHQPSQSTTQPSPQQATACPCARGSCAAPQAGQTRAGLAERRGPQLWRRPRRARCRARGAALGPAAGRAGGRGRARGPHGAPAAGRWQGSPAPRPGPARSGPARCGACRAGKSLCVPQPGTAQRLPPAARAAAERGLPLPGDAGFPRGSGAAAAARPYPQLP